jgi:SNF2 family DNA or RNA helicase
MTLPIYNELAVKYQGTYITGEVDSEQRQANVKRFQEDSNCKFIVGTIGAMGTGLTLTAGTVEIFMDEPWNRANKEQAEDRCHRVGTTENVTIYTLLCKDTIDERIHELVYKKGAMADALVDGKITENKAEVLEYLLS